MKRKKVEGVWRWALCGAIGLVLGAGSGLALTGGLIGGGAALKSGQWATNPLIGQPAADPWTRARVARVGLLALTREETVYFDRAVDETGAPLDGACTYEIAGGPIPARWWSITVYGADQMLARNEDDAASLDKTRLGPAADGAWRATLGPRREGEAQWLSSNGAAAPILMLRLYNPQAQTDAGLAALALPSVRKLSCGGAP
jgi:hypothetical protein